MSAHSVLDSMDGHHLVRERVVSVAVAGTLWKRDRHETLQWNDDFAESRVGNESQQWFEVSGHAHALLRLFGDAIAQLQQTLAQFVRVVQELAQIVPLRLTVKSSNIIKFNT